MAHKHAELIKAWADGAVIERSVNGNGEWVPVSNPTWLVGQQYRIKPEPNTTPPGGCIRRLARSSQGARRTD